MNKQKEYQLTIAWLYPDLMSTYGDRGNIITLQKRCEWRGINTTIEKISINDDPNKLADCSLILMGGAEDRQQEIVSADLQKGKDKILKELIDRNVPGLFICGAYQFLGTHYKEADGSIIKGLGIFDVHTENSGTNHDRLIGDIVIDTEIIKNILIGFENHGGRTFLGKGLQPFGKVLRGFGNNGDDQTEGAVYKNAFGTYLHGPILPKNPDFADYLIKKALEIKYKEEMTLENLDGELENHARQSVAQKLRIQL